MLLLNPFISQTAVKSVLTVILTLLVAVLADNILRSFVQVPKHFEGRRSRTYATIIRNIITVVVYGIALHIIFIELGINITPLLASAGIIGITVGIGAKALIEDLINGMFLLTQDSIAIGDYVKLDEAEGNIENIGFRTLFIRGGDGALYIIPNGQVKRVINFSRHSAQVNVEFPVKADQDIDTVLKIMREALADLQKEEKADDVILDGSGVNGIVDFKAVGPMIVTATIVTHPTMRWEVARKYRYLVKKGFEKNKILFG